MSDGKLYQHKEETTAENVITKYSYGYTWLKLRLKFNSVKTCIKALNVTKRILTL
jgi:hypothetical protein